jgi:hypothetical protein
MPDQYLLCDELRQLLDVELAAGNEIKETNVDFPRAGAVFVGLKKKFRSAPAQLPECVVYRVIDDVHWWQAEYEHLPTGHYLVCGFDE